MVEMNRREKFFCTSLHFLIGIPLVQTGIGKHRCGKKNCPTHVLSVTIGKQLAAVGGSSGGHSYSSTIYFYSNHTNAWVYVGNLPVACHSTCTVVLPSRELLTVGGEAKKKALSCAFRAKIQSEYTFDSYKNKFAVLANYLVTVVA